MFNTSSRTFLGRPLVAAVITTLTLSTAHADYPSAVLSDGPLAYYRLNTATLTTDTATNRGTILSAGEGTHDAGVKLGVSGALAGNPNTAANYRKKGPNGSNVHTLVPYNPALNPPLSSDPFTIEFWTKPDTIVDDGPGPCPLFNRVSSGDRSGWVFFRRSPTSGYNFVMYNGNGSTRAIDITGGTNSLDSWSHIVAVWNGAQASLYCNGVLVAGPTSPTGSYNPSTSAPLSVGGYDDGQNPGDASVDEVAIYTTVLSPAQILAHYQAGTNTSPATLYSTLVTSLNPVEYLRLDEPAHNVATNLGTLGAAANGFYFETLNPQSGPQSPAFVGFEPDNLAAGFNGSSSQIALGNPAGLNISGQITLEAWIQPYSTPGPFGNIIAHGIDAGLSSNEVVLRIQDNNTYWISSHSPSGDFGTSALIPAGDMDSGQWVHLVGTYDGANWNLYRNGIQLAFTPSATGALPVNDSDWAIGARGDGNDRFYVGLIDEAAIYSHVLSPSQVQSHYSVGVYGVPPLSITRSAGNVTLTYPTGTLEEATSVTGPYSDVIGATSPHTFPATAPSKFYRVRF